MRTLSKFGIDLYQRNLKNGAQVFLFKRSGMPIYIRASFFAGSRFDEITGTAHFLEHILTAGTQKFPSKNLIAEYIQEVGGEFSAGTSNNVLHFNVEIPEKSDLRIGVEVIRECLTRSLFDSKIIETERGSIYSEINAKRSNPKEYVWEVSRRITLSPTNASRSTLGTIEEVSSIHPDLLKSFFNTHIHSGNVAFIVSGDVEIDSLLSELEKIDLPAGEKFIIDAPLPIVRDKIFEVENYPNLDQLQVVLSNRVLFDSYKEYCAFAVLNNILAVGRGSRLMTKLRYKTGIVYSISGSLFEGPDYGTFGINFSCDKKNYEQAKQLIFGEFENLKKNNIENSEFQRTKSKISKGLIRLRQTSESWVKAHENEALFNSSSMKTSEDYINTINELTVKDIKHVIDKYLIEKDFYTAVCGDITN